MGVSVNTDNIMTKPNKNIDALVKDIEKKISEFRRTNKSSGDCELCGEWSSLLIEGVCTPCRNRCNIK